LEALETLGVLLLMMIGMIHLHITPSSSSSSSQQILRQWAAVATLWRLACLTCRHLAASWESSSSSSQYLHHMQTLLQVGF
jgi:hypothetical protein